MTQAILQIVQFAFFTFYINRDYAWSFGNNPASARVLEKAGFAAEVSFNKTVCKHGVYLDV